VNAALSFRPAPPRAAARPREGTALVEAVLVAGAFIAPLEIRLAGSFTVYDLTVVALAFLIVAGPHRLRPFPRGLRGPAFVFLIAAVLSAFRATYPMEALTQTLEFAFIFLLQIPAVLTAARSERAVRLAVAAVIAGSLVAIAISAVTEPRAGAGRIVAFFSDNPNRLGYPVAYLLPFVLVFLRDWWRRGARALAAGVAAGVGYLFVWALAASASRGAIAGTLVALLLVVGFAHGPALDRRVLLRLAGVVALAALGWTLVTRTTVFPSTLQHRIDRTLAGEESLLSDRERLAVAGWRAFEASPFLGTGLDNFRYVAVLYEDSATEQAPHNLWLALLAQVGLFGTVAFLFIVARWFLALLRAHRASRLAGRRRLLWAFVASMAAILVIFMSIPVMVHRHYWLLFGLGLAAVALPEDRQPLSIPRHPEGRS
jgi:O-antigen ligase